MKKKILLLAFAITLLPTLYGFHSGISLGTIPIQKGYWPHTFFTETTIVTKPHAPEEKDNLTLEMQIVAGKYPKNLTAYLLKGDEKELAVYPLGQYCNPEKDIKLFKYGTNLKPIMGLLFLPSSQEENIASTIKRYLTQEKKLYGTSTGISQTAKFYGPLSYTIQDLPFVDNCDWSITHQDIPLVLYLLKDRLIKDGSSSSHLVIAIRDDLGFSDE